MMKRHALKMALGLRITRCLSFRGKCGEEA